jgi:hypothetical protein
MMYIFVYKDYWTKEIKRFKTLDERYGWGMTSHPDTLLYIFKVKAK